jgi:hypothetical protein
MRSWGARCSYCQAGLTLRLQVDVIAYWLHARCGRLPGVQPSLAALARRAPAMVA